MSCAFITGGSKILETLKPCDKIARLEDATASVQKDKDMSLGCRLQEDF